MPWNWPSKSEIAHLRTHNLTINSPCQNSFYELLQFNLHTKWEVLNNNKHTIQSPCMNIRLFKGNKEIHSHTENLNPTKRWDEPKMTFYSIFHVFIQLIVGGLCGSAKHHDDGNKTGSHTRCLSLEHALTQTHTLDLCTAWSISAVECAPTSPQLRLSVIFGLRLVSVHRQETCKGRQAQW